MGILSNLLYLPGSLDTVLYLPEAVKVGRLLLATFSSKAATCLFFAFAIAFVVFSSAFPGAASCVQIQELDVMQMERPMILRIFITSMTRRPIIIIHDS